MSHKELVVTFGSKLRFNLHYVDILSRASKISCFALRSSHQFIEIHSLVIPFSSFVHSILKCASVISSSLRKIIRVAKAHLEGSSLLKSLQMQTLDELVRINVFDDHL